MERVSIDGTDRNGGDGFDLRRLSDPLGTTDLAINHYRVAPGEGLPAGLHAHADQEEVFVVLAGEATFETLGGESGAGESDGAGGDDADESEGTAGAVTVAEGEAIRFGRGEFQSGRNGGDDDLELLALGAPRDSEDVRIPVGCPECDREDLRLEFGAEMGFVCPNCGAERTPADCPDCGGADLQVTLGEGLEPIVACADCGAEYDRPPVEGEWER